MAPCDRGNMTEITPEMIRAGTDILFELEGDCSKATLAELVYRAMVSAESRHCRAEVAQGQIHIPTALVRYSYLFKELSGRFGEPGNYTRRADQRLVTRAGAQQPCDLLLIRGALELRLHRVRRTGHLTERKGRGKYLGSPIRGKSPHHAMLPRRLLSLIFLDYAGTNRPLCLSTCAIESRRAAFLQHHNGRLSRRSKFA